MDVTKTGAIYDLKRFRSPRPRQIPASSSSFMEGADRFDDDDLQLDTRDRFEHYFLASPRAQELYSTLEKAKQYKPSPQKPVLGSVPGFDEVFNVAQFFHNNRSRSSNISSLYTDQPSTSEKQTAFPSSTRAREFEVSPLRPPLNDSVMKKKVSMVLNKLEDDNAPYSDTAKDKGPSNTPTYLSRDSGFTEAQSDSGGSIEGMLTNVAAKWQSQDQRGRASQGRGIGNLPGLYSVNTQASAAVPQSIVEEQGESFESSCDEEIDVETEDFQGGEPEDMVADENCYSTSKDGEENHPKKVVDEEQRQGQTKDGTENCEVHGDGSTDVVPETPQTSSESNSRIVTSLGRRNEVNKQKQGGERTSNMETSTPLVCSVKPLDKKASKTNTLSQWSIKAMKTRTHMGVIVEGQRSEDPEGDLWHSTAIVLRVNSRCVQTKSGSQYMLKGPIDETVALAQGFSKTFVKAFKNGFPTNWISLVACHFESQSSSENSEDEKEVQPQQLVKKKQPSRAARDSTRSTPSDSKTQQKTNKDVKTPINQTLSREVELQRTRSGRMVKPPLAWWRGQRILTDRDHNLEGIAPGGDEHTPLSAMYCTEIKLPFKSEPESPDKQSSSSKPKRSKSDVEMDDEAPRKNNTKVSLSAKNVKSKELSSNLVDKKMRSKQCSPPSSGSQILQEKETSRQESGPRSPKVLQRIKNTHKSSPKSKTLQESEEEESTDQEKQPRRQDSGARSPKVLQRIRNMQKSSPKSKTLQESEEEELTDQEKQPRRQDSGARSPKVLQRIKNTQKSSRKSKTLQESEEEELTDQEKQPRRQESGPRSPKVLLKIKNTHKSLPKSKTLQESEGEESTDHEKEPTSKHSSRLQQAEKHPLPLRNMDTKSGRSSDISQLGENSDSSSEKDSEELLKKQLFVSPKVSSGKTNRNHRVSRGSQEAGLDSGEIKGTRNGGLQQSSVRKSVHRSPQVERDIVQVSCGGEFSTSKSEGPGIRRVQEVGNNSIPGKDAQQNKRNKSRRNTNKLNSDSESGNKEQEAVKSPSPVKRVLRSHKNKTGSTMRVMSTVRSNKGASSEVDSEDLQEELSSKKNSRSQKNSDNDSRHSSCGEVTDSTEQSEIISKTRKLKKTVEKRLVHKRIAEIASTETSDSQNSEEESERTSQKRSKQEQRPAKNNKQTEETRTKTGKDKRKSSAPAKGSGKDESDSDRAAGGSKKASKVSARTVNSYAKSAEVVSDDVWQGDEIQRLNNALHRIPASTPMFWQKIARRVESRTAQECQFKHQGQALVSNKKEPSGRKGAAADKKGTGQKVISQQAVKTVTGGVGTIKRKRELRELLEQQDVNYEDDIFDATPFKRKKDLKLPFNLNCNDSDEEDDDEDDIEGEVEQHTSYKTPSNRTPSSRFRPLGPLSSSTTPASEFISPSLLQQVNRKDMDHYIYRMQQGKRGAQAVSKQKTKMKTSTPKKKVTGDQWPALDMELFEAQPASDQASEDGDDDYYFSDE